MVSSISHSLCIQPISDALTPSKENSMATLRNAKTTPTQTPPTRRQRRLNTQLRTSQDRYDDKESGKVEHRDAEGGGDVGEG